MRSDDLDWLPPSGAHLTLKDVTTMLISLRSLIDGTDVDEPNRAHAIAIAIAYVLTAAIDREET